MIGNNLCDIPGQAGSSAQTILANVVREAKNRQGRSVFAIGCPESYARGDGSVCCANTVSTVLKAAEVDFVRDDAVVNVVANLRAKEWQLNGYPGMDSYRYLMDGSATGGVLLPPD